MKKRTIIVFALAVLACLSIFSLTACTKSYNVSFETNGGQTISTVKVKENENYVLPEPVKADCVFDGWYLNKELTGSAITSIQPAADVTVYAKWANLATITLDAKGGSLSSSQIKLKEGENVYQAVKDLKPTKTDCQFAYWTVNGKELSKNLTASASGITLTAAYKVKYEVNIFKQEITDDGKAGGYPDKAEVITGYAFAGTDFDVTENHVFQGFYVSEATHDDMKTEAVISENASENVFKVYYDRRTVKVRFYSEYPVSSLTEKVVTKDVLFGAKVELPVKDFVCEGYMLTGWKDLENDVTYAVNSIAERLFDAETQKIGVSAESVKLDDIAQNTDFRAVWSKGIPDMYGGYDTLFLTKNDAGEEEAYIQRGDVFFKCVYFGEEDGERLFTLETEAKQLEEGKIFEGDLYFAYKSSTRSEYNPTRFVSGEGFDETEKMQFDAYNGVTYLYYDENGTVISEKTSHGTYEVDSNGYYTATFEDGALAGKTITFNIGTASNRSAFQLRDEEEAGYGVMSYYYASNGMLVSSETLTSPTRLYLSGFGIGLLYSGGSTSYVYYVRNADVLTLQTTGGQSVGTFKIFEATDGSKGFVSYTSSMDATFTFENGKGSLKTDGMYKAEYTDENGATYEGTYSVSGTSVVFGGTIIKFKSTSFDASLIISVVTSQNIAMVDGKPTVVEVTKYYLESKHYDYAERSYYGRTNNKTAVNSNLVIVLNENESGEASVYVKVQKTEGEKTSSSYQKVNYGTYALNDDNLYEVTLTGYNAPDGEITGVPFSFDFEQLTSIIFDQASVSSTYVAYWYSYTLGTEEVENIKRYINSDTETGGKIEIIDGSVAIVTVGSSKIIGSISTDEETGLTTIAGSTYFYCVLDEENSAFTVASRPFGAYVMERYGSANQYFFIQFDGMGGATYHYLKEVDGKYETDEKGSYVQYTFKGTYKEVSGEKLTIGNAQYPVYIFETNEYMGEENSQKTIKFARIIMNNYYFALFFREEEKDATYRVSDSLEKLVLDGYLVATYTDADGNTHTGIYTKEENEIVFYGERYYYFVVDGNNLTVKGEEYGTYFVIENQAPKKNYWITLNGDVKNGQGTATVFVYETDEDGNLVYNDGTAVRKVIADNAVYTYNTETGKVVVKFTDGNAEITYEGMLGSVTSGSSTIPVLAIIHEEMAETYVDADNLNVLVLDSVGNAVFYGKQGTAKTGYYTLINDNILFFMPSDGSTNGTGIYKYDRQNHIVSYQKTDIPSAGYGYFTEEFEGLFFTSYGLAQIEGDSNYYFEYDDVNETLTLYKQEPADADANEYGFVNKGEIDFASTIDLNGKHYIRYEGRNLTATRSENEQNKYPFRYGEGDNLYNIKNFVFRPTGKTFSVSANVTISNRAETDASKKESTVTAAVIRKTAKFKDGVELPDDTTETDYTEKTVTYLQIGYFEFTLSLTYSAVEGSDEGKATFAVQSARMVKSGESAYVTNMAVYMQMFGMDATEFINENKDAFGEMSVIETLDENGEVVNKAASAKFGEGTRYVDSQGNNLSFEGADNYSYNGSYYTLDITGKDGVDYRMNFSFGATYASTVGYTMNAFTRIQTEVSGNYKFVLERTLYSDSSFKAGSLFNPGALEIYETVNGEEKKVEIEVYYTPSLADGETGVKYALISRTRDEKGKIVTSRHIEIHLTDKDPENNPYKVTSSSGTETLVTSYELASAEVKEMKVYYDANGTGSSAGRYVEIDADHNVVIYGFDGGSAYLVTNSDYDTETGVYTIIWESNGQTLAVNFTVNDDNKTFTEYQTQENQ